MTANLVLASNSPRRRELLTLGGWSFHVKAADVDESVRPGEAAEDYVLRLAQEKAGAIMSTQLEDGSANIVLAADTAVVDSGSIFGKPRHSQEAIQMLRQLRGHTHQVVTALAALRVHDNRMVTEICVTDVPMRAYSDTEIETYVASQDPMDKAGAYAIQNRSFRPVLALRGCYASVMGLPLCHLHRALNQLGAPSPVDLPSVCQAGLDYECDYYPQVFVKPA